MIEQARLLDEMQDVICFLRALKDRTVVARNGSTPKKAPKGRGRA